MTTSPHDHPFTRLRAGTRQTLDQDLDRFDPAGHLWHQSEIHALTVAMAARRPLLVRGEAGCGKSQLVRAAAAVLKGRLHVEVIHPRFEALDLLWRFDAVQRLADAQVRDDNGRSLLDPTNVRYVRYGALGSAIRDAEGGDGAQPLDVVLIDEIDKADADLPNALLEVLGNRSFKADPLDRVHKVPPERMPLVVITTNEERELPAAFVRRCVVLNLNPPREEAALKRWLMERAAAHERLNVVDSAVRETAARQVLADRVAADKAGYPKVGLAEYIDLLMALAELTETLEGEARAETQRDWLEQLSAYVLVKNARQDQDRSPVPATAT